MDVLVLLAEHSDSVVTRDEILDAVWGDADVGEQVLTRAISELRLLLGDDTRESRFIATIRKGGYQLVAPLAMAAMKNPTGMTPVEVAVSEEVLSPEHLSTVVEGEKTGTEAGEAIGTPENVSGFLFSRPRHWLILLSVVCLAIVTLVRLIGFGQKVPERIEIPTVNLFTSYPGREIDPDFSPDGSQIAVCVERWQR